MTYLWLKALHIIFMTSWFAGLFYLPRLFVNLAMAESNESYRHLLQMANKLYRFVTPFMILTIILGLWMVYMNQILWSFLWFKLKLVMVTSLVIYHFWCGHYLKLFQQKNSKNSHVFYRWFNEFPVLILFAVVILVVVKPVF
jgi:protoporphyrinogen IX oxidase